MCPAEQLGPLLIPEISDPWRLAHARENEVFAMVSLCFDAAGNPLRIKCSHCSFENHFYAFPAENQCAAADSDCEGEKQRGGK